MNPITQALRIAMHILNRTYIPFYYFHNYLPTHVYIQSGMSNGKRIYVIIPAKGQSDRFYLEVHHNSIMLDMEPFYYNHEIMGKSILQCGRNHLNSRTIKGTPWGLHPLAPALPTVTKAIYDYLQVKMKTRPRMTLKL